MKRAVLLLAILTLWTPLVRADDDTPHNIYHSLKRFFTGSDGHHASPSSSRHRSGKRTHAQSATQGSAAAGPSTTPETTVQPEGSPVPRPADAATPAQSISRPATADKAEPSPAGSPTDYRVVVLPTASPVARDGTPAPAGSPAPNPAPAPAGQGQP
ncbi:MAG TPA: hypothetical protein VGD78_01300 [Chthoniobacterales bacterium]